MKKFSQFLDEGKGFDTLNTKPKTVVDKTRDRQQKEKEQLKVRQDREMNKARDQDFRDKEQKRTDKENQKRALQASKNAQKSEDVDADFDDGELIPEYLEDGTLTLVRSYKLATPGE